MHLYAKQEQTHRQKTKQWLPKGRGKEEGQISGMGLTDTHYHIESR